MSLSASDNSYSAPSDLAKWDMYNILYDDTPLKVYSHNYYIRADMENNSEAEPSVVARDPSDNTLYFNPVDDSYTIVGYYWTVAESLSADGDVPSIPTPYHKLIVYRAVADFAAFMGNAGLFQLYNQKASSLMGKLLRNYNPGKRILPRPVA